MLQIRQSEAAFSPHAEQQVLDCGGEVFAVLRSVANEGESVLCLHNVTNQPVALNITAAGSAAAADWAELLHQRSLSVSVAGMILVTLQPYEVHWLKAQGPPPRKSGLQNGLNSARFGRLAPAKIETFRRSHLPAS